MLKTNNIIVDLFIFPISFVHFLFDIYRVSFVRNALWCLDKLTLNIMICLAPLIIFLDLQCLLSNIDMSIPASILFYF